MKHLYRNFDAQLGKLVYKEKTPERVIDFEGDVKDQLSTLKGNVEGTEDKKDRVKARQKYYQGLREAASGKNKDKDSQTEAQKTLKHLREKYRGSKVEAGAAKDKEKSPTDIATEKLVEDQSKRYEAMNNAAVTTAETPAVSPAPATEAPAPASAEPVITEEPMVEAELVTEPLAPPSTPVEAAAEEPEGDLMARVDKLKGRVEALKVKTAELGAVVDNNARELEELKKDDFASLSEAQSGAEDPAPSTAEPAGTEGAKATETPTFKPDYDYEPPQDAAGRKKTNDATKDLLIKEEEKVDARRKKAAEDKERQIKEDEDRKRAMEEREAAYKKTVEELQAKAEKQPKAPTEISNQPTSSKAPPVDKTGTRPDIVEARTEAQAREKAYQEALAKEQAERDSRIIEKYGKPLREAIANGNKTAVLEIEKALTGDGKKPEIISRLQQALMILDNKKEAQALVNILDRGLFRRLAKQHLRLLTKGVEEQENLPERVYQHTSALKEAFRSNNGAEVAKIEDQMNYHRGLRGGGEIKRGDEIAKRKQSVINELSREELQYIVDNGKAQEEKNRPSLKELAQKRLETMPKAD